MPGLRRENDSSPALAGRLKSKLNKKITASETVFWSKDPFLHNAVSVQQVSVEMNLIECSTIADRRRLNSERDASGQRQHDSRRAFAHVIGVSL